MSSEQYQDLAQVDPGWAWSEYQPNQNCPWNLSQAAHLHRRAGMGARWSELQISLQSGPAEAVERLIAGPAETSDFEREMAFSTAHLLGQDSIDGLAAWWLYVMLATPHPLKERMILFWHGHFATSYAKVRSARLMYRQHQSLRDHALGSFSSLLGEMARAPAMLVWLDSASNKKARPNENFAREVMELFSLGLGHYSERDIQEAARAFTGWELRQNRFYFNRQQHDSGAKTVLGQTGPWTGDDVLRILLEQNAAAQFIVGRLFRYLISEVETPPPGLITPLADGFRTQNYDISWLLRRMLGSNLFFSPPARRQKIKGPVELAVGLLRSLEGMASTSQLADDLAALGQAVFQPPTVKGWDGGREWITSATVLGRIDLAWALVSGTRLGYGKKIDVVAVLKKQGIGDVSAAVDRLALLLLGEPPSAELKLKLIAAAGGQEDPDSLRYARVVQALASLPEFQLA